MSTPDLIHGHFTIERIYDAAPARVFEAWADPEVKARWFVGPAGWTQVKRELDFRVGGVELLHGRFSGGPDTVFTARYHEIVRDERIVYVYDMHVDKIFLSVSLASVVIRSHEPGSRMIFTEQAVFLDGKDGSASRQRGTAAHFDRLAEQFRAGR